MRAGGGAAKEHKGNLSGWRRNAQIPRRGQGESEMDLRQGREWTLRKEWALRWTKTARHSGHAGWLAHGQKNMRGDFEGLEGWKFKILGKYNTCDGRFFRSAIQRTIEIRTKMKKRENGCTVPQFSELERWSNHRSFGRQAKKLTGLLG